MTHVATFWTTHKPSKSKAFVEFKLYNKKVKLTHIAFATGNVIDINVVRAFYKKAQLLLSAPW